MWIFVSFSQFRWILLTRVIKPTNKSCENLIADLVEIDGSVMKRNRIRSVRYSHILGHSFKSHCDLQDTTTGLTRTKTVIIL